MEEGPQSLETRMLLSSMKRDAGYPFLRATRWFLRVVVSVYVVVGVILAVGLGGSMSGDTREVVAWWGGPEKGHGGMAAMMLMASVAVRAMLVLAVSEAIKLLLDIRAAQSDAATAHGDLASKLEPTRRGN